MSLKITEKQEIMESIQGRVLPPILLWLVGVPGSVCLILWLFFFRGN